MVTGVSSNFDRVSQATNYDKDVRIVAMDDLCLELEKDSQLSVADEKRYVLQRCQFPACSAMAMNVTQAVSHTCATQNY